MKYELALTRWKKIIVYVLLIAALMGLLIWFLFSEIMPVSGDFRNNLWGPSYQLIHGMSPYNIRPILDGLNPIWMPVIIGIFFPIGFLPLQMASNLWFILGALALFLLVVILARAHKRSTLLVLPATVFLAIFPSSIAHFKLGQVSLIIVLLLFILLLFRNHWKPGLIGLILAMSLTKPQLIVIFLPVFCVVLFRERGVKDTLRAVVFALFWSLVFCLPLFLLYPGWIRDLLQNISENPFWKYPTLYAVLLMLFKTKTLAMAIAGLFLLVGIWIGVFLSFKLNGKEALMWSLSLTPIFSPVVWSWDFVFIYPLLILMAFDRRSKIGSWITTAGFVTCLVLFIVMKNAGYVNDIYAIWVPIFLNIVLAVSYLVRVKSLRQSTVSQVA